MHHNILSVLTLTAPARRSLQNSLPLSSRLPVSLTVRNGYLQVEMGGVA